MTKFLVPLLLAFASICCNDSVAEDLVSYALVSDRVYVGSVINWKPNVDNVKNGTIQLSAEQMWSPATDVVSIRSKMEIPYSTSLLDLAENNKRGHARFANVPS